MMADAIQTPSQLSAHLRALRKLRGLSQAELGLKLNLSQERIARIEGEPLSVKTGQILDVLTALGVRLTLEPLPGSEEATHPHSDAPLAKPSEKRSEKPPLPW